MSYGLLWKPRSSSSYIPDSGQPPPASIATVSCSDEGSLTTVTCSDQGSLTTVTCSDSGSMTTVTTYP